MVLKKMDALEFVSSLEGGWDTIIWDPPYFHDEKQFVTKGWENAKEIEYRLIIDPLYLNQVRTIINQKMDSGFWILFYNNAIPNNTFDYEVFWYKGEEYGGMGGYIKKNMEYVYINSFNKKPNPNHPLKKIEYHDIGNPGSKKVKALEKPISLLKRILLFCNSSYVLDPFAGSYSTAKACDYLQIKYDSCDKITKPKKLLKNFMEK